MKCKENSFARAFIKPVYGLSAELQHRLCQQAASERDLNLISIYESEWGSDKKQGRDKFVRAIRSDEVALVARLDVLGRSKKELNGRRPTIDFIAVIREIERKALCVVEADTGISADNERKWETSLETAINRISQGRVLSRRKAQAMAKKSWKKRKRGVATEWNRPERAEEKARWSQHWRDPKFPNTQAAFDALPVALQETFGTVTTANKVLGPRKPGAGLGRPKKKRKRHL